MAVKIIPPCVGYYETGEEACDGDPRGTTDTERKACDWRPGCGAFKDHLKDEGKVQSDYLQILEEPVFDDDGDPVIDGDTGEPMLCEVGRARDGGKAFYNFCVRLVQEREVLASALIQPVQPGKKSKRRKETPVRGPRGELRRKIRRGSYVGVARKREHMLVWGEALFAELIERIGPERRKRGRGAPAVGQCYVLVTDTAPHISYRVLTLYCRTGKGRDRPILRLRPRQERTFDVHFPVSAEILEKVLGEGLAEVGVVESWNHGYYLSRVKRVDEGGMKVAIRAAATLVRRKKIKLPELQARGAG